MKKKICFVVVMLFQISFFNQQAISCSTFCLKDSSNIIYGRSFDWDIGYGYMMTNLRDVTKTRFLPYDEIPATWTSQYGSVTFNQYGREYPIGGINETGLVVEVMTLRNTQYVNQDERAAIDELGWVQYQLDNSATIQDVIDSDKKIRISNKTFVKLHFLITDKNGETLVVEFLNGKVTYHYKESLPQACLTNTDYTNSLSYLKTRKGFGGEEPIDYKNHASAHSLERFAIVSDMLSDYKTDSNMPIVDYSFTILDHVKDYKRSQFQIVYDIPNKRIYFRSLQSTNIKIVDLEDFNFDCTTTPMMIDINTTQQGNISENFTPYDLELNKELIIKSYRETGFNVPESILIKIAECPENFKCKQHD